MNQDTRLSELYKKRDNFYSKFLPQFIAIPIIVIILLITTYLTITELRIWIFGERTEVPIERLYSGTNEYYLFIKLGNKTIKKRIRKTTFKRLKKGTPMRVIFWEDNPIRSIFLDLNERNDIFKLFLGEIICFAFLFGTVIGLRKLKLTNPDKGA